MKTMKKAIAFSIATSITAMAFGQLGLGVTSSTQAVVNATTATNAVAQTTQATSAITKSTAQIAVNKATEIKITTGATVNQAAGATNDLKADVKNMSDVKGGTAVNTSANASGGIQTNNSSVQTGAGSNTTAGADMQINGSKVIDRTETASSTLANTVENKAQAAVQTTKEVKAQAVTDVKAASQATKETTASVKPQASVAAEAKSETKATITKQ